MSNIALVGPMHSGKTSVARFLVEEYGFEKIALADPVKDVSALMLTSFDSYFGGNRTYDREDMNTIKGHPSIRKLLQLVGTELGRNWRGPEDIWITKFLETVAVTSRSVVNDDCRFVNEAERLRERGFVIVRLMRNEVERLDSIRASLRLQHPNEPQKFVEAKLEEMLSHPSETEQVNIVEDLCVYGNSVKQITEALPLLLYGMGYDL